MINWIKNDFNSVKMGLDDITKGRAPKWAIVLWYVLLFPVGIIALPFVKIWTWNYVRKTEKRIEKMRRGEF